MAGNLGSRQFDFSFFPVVAFLGQRLRGGSSADELTHAVVASGQVVNPGDVLEMKADGSVQAAQAVNASPLPIVGVAIYKDAKQPRGLLESTNGFQAGEMVPILRKGKVWAKWVGTTRVPGAALNLSHSSTTAANQGAFTDAATATTAGSEVSLMAGVFDSLVPQPTTVPAGMVLADLVFAAA
jgi:hypothetical protein